MTIQRLTAYGIIYKKTSDGVRFLVTKSYLAHYTFLGGGIKRGESPNEALLREIKEEVGVGRDHILKIIPLSFSGKSSMKLIFITIENVTRYFVLEFRENEKLVPNWEIKQISWLNKNEAIRTLTFPSSRSAMEKALELIESWNK